MMPETDIKWALDALKQRASDYQLARDYYYGKHRLDFVPAEFRRDFSQLLRRARLNMCPAVVTSVRDRLKLSGMTGDEKDKELKTLLSETWRHNRVEQRSGEIHLEALMCGDSFAVVWPSMISGKVTIYPQNAQMVTVLYDDEEPDLIIRAAKWWVEDKFTYLCLYYPDVIETYIATKKDNLNDKSFILDSEVYNQYGRVPVFHFGNGAGVSGFGMSELHDAIPVQDGLNKTVRDMLIGGENMSLPQRYATGVEAAIDSTTGKPVNQWIPGDFWTARNESAKFGQLDAANLDQLQKVKDGYKLDMALVTGIPPHYFFAGGGTPPSGESLKTLEQRLTSRVRDRQVGFGNTWEGIFKFILQIEGKVVEVDAVWENTVPRDESAYQTSAIERVEKLDVSKRQAMKELGYTDEEIDRMKEEKATEDVIPTVLQ